MFNKYKVKSVIDNSNRLSGIYNGKVVNTADPGFKGDGAPLGRVQVSIPGLTEGIEDKDLPWYSVRIPVDDSPQAKMKIPPVGSQVVVEFLTNDIYNGLVSYVIVSSPPQTR